MPNGQGVVVFRNSFAVCKEFVATYKNFSRSRSA